MRRTLLFLLLCSSVPAVQAQEPAPAPGRLLGMLLDSSSLEPIYGAVYLLGTSRGAVTSDEGWYEIENVPAGTYTLIINAPYYAKDTIPNVIVQPGITRRDHWKLPPPSLKLWGEPPRWERRPAEPSIERVPGPKR
jgi:hypothetical protein